MKKIAVLASLVFVLFSVAVLAAKDGVMIREKPGVGKYLTDSDGKTLYWFKKDSPGKSACAGGCSEKWPSFQAEKVSPPKGFSKEDFATITRQDGKKQTTFRDYPLYYFENDKKPGDTNGQGLNDAWFVVNPDNFPPK